MWWVWAVHCLCLSAERSWKEQKLSFSAKSHAGSLFSIFDQVQWIQLFKLYFTEEKLYGRRLRNGVFHKKAHLDHELLAVEAAASIIRAQDNLTKPRFQGPFDIWQLLWVKLQTSQRRLQHSCFGRNKRRRNYFLSPRLPVLKHIICCFAVYWSLVI